MEIFAALILAVGLGAVAQAISKVATALGYEEQKETEERDYDNPCL